MEIGNLKLETVRTKTGKRDNKESLNKSCVFRFKKKKDNGYYSQSGFSIIELVIGVVIIGISFVAAMYAHTQIQANSTRVEFTLRSTVLANSVMKVVRSNNFDENESPPWSSPLGPDEPSSSEFDDVDDYIGYVWPTQSSGYIGYNVTARVFYVNPSINWTDSTGVITDYKRIIISVETDGLPQPVVLSSLITPRVGTAETEGLSGPPPPPPG